MEARVAIDPEFPLTFRIEGDQIFLAINGQPLHLPHHPALGRLLRDINTGRKLSVAGLCQKHAGHKKGALPQAMLLKILETLYAFRGIDRVGSDQ
jgi:hypothetical protein